MLIKSLRAVLYGGLLWPLCLAAQSVADTQSAVQPDQAKAKELFDLANQSRVQNGAGALRWDDSLADAALKHCARMIAEVTLEHRYSGEQDLTSRAGEAGAHFSVIEENIAVGSHIATIHQGWLDSPEHRTNLLNPAVDRVGIRRPVAREAHRGDAGDRRRQKELHVIRQIFRQWIAELSRSMAES